MKTRMLRPAVACSAVLALLSSVQVARGEKTWTAGTPINEPSITAPANNSRYGISTRVTLTCNPPTDTDHWTEGCCSSGDEPDPAVKATWSDGGAQGSFPSGNVGNSVTYVTPANTGNVTLTVTFDDTGTSRGNDDPRSASITIIVVSAKMIFKVGGNEASAITRAESGTFEVVDNDGNEITGATYANWAFAGTVPVTDTITTRTWGRTIVEPGTASCDVTFGGNTCKVSKTITVNARAAWSITPSCDEDNEAGFGTYPGAVTLGENRDKVQDQPQIIWPRGTNFQDGYTTAKVATGPNKDVWYISASTFAISRETVINKFAKAGATGFPDPPQINWHEYNESRSVDADGLLVGLKGHELRGTPGNAKGHQKFLEDEEAKDGRDAKTAIEDNIGATEAALKTATGNEVSGIDTAIYNAAAVAPTGNWGPATVWIYVSGWSSTTYGN